MGRGGNGIYLFDDRPGSGHGVFLPQAGDGQGAQRIFLGFAAGVMVAASVWSLLIPAIEEAESRGVPGWLPRRGDSCWAWAF